MLSTAEAMTGLSLPEDLQTLLGDGLSVAVDGSIDLDPPSAWAAATPASRPVPASWVTPTRSSRCSGS